MIIANSSQAEPIAAVVLAAGLSTRMGRPKLVLPWRETTVIGQVVGTLAQAGVAEIVVVCGAAHEMVGAVLRGMPARMIFNPRYTEDSMMISLQTGLAALSAEIGAALVVLGDQPQMQMEVIQAVVAGYRQSKAWLVVPSFHMRRGHPWLAARPLWQAILAASPAVTLRDFLNAQAARIQYVNIETDSILQDLDTPDDYEKAR